MMRRSLFIVCIVVVVLALVMTAAAAKTDTKNVDSKNGDKQNNDNGSNAQGQPFQDIWKAIKDLQKNLDEIRLIPGPAGPQGPKGDTGTCSCEVSLSEFNALKARVGILEGQHLDQPCHEGTGVCTGVGTFVLE